MQAKYQQGVGLIEVLVALLLLAIAVLGFVALQFRAVEATSEGFNRIQAMNIARDLTEKMRINNSSAAIARYKNRLATQDRQAADVSSCYSAFCSPVNKASFDVHETYLKANNLGMTVTMMSCPSTANGRQCIYVAWNKTDATNAESASDAISSTTGHSACTTSSSTSFSYNESSTCVVMEAY